jgi:hypothetical protein
MMYFVGDKPGHFPFRNGPVLYLKARDLDDVLPAFQIRSILRHLEISEERFASTERHPEDPFLDSLNRTKPN